jgi:hypothetical protein
MFLVSMPGAYIATAILGEGEPWSGRVSVEACKKVLYEEEREFSGMTACCAKRRDSMGRLHLA